MISGLFSGGLYLLPIFTGAYADKIGFRKSMIIAFSLLSIGYLGLGLLPTLLEAAGLVEYGETTRFSGLPDSNDRWMIVPVLFVIMVGGSFINSIISGSVAKETTEATRARGYSIFYMMVNIGAFTGNVVPYKFPVLEMGLFILVLFGMELILSVWTIRRQKKQSLIEQMRAME